MHDDEMLRLVHDWWPFETNVGQLTLAEFHDRYGVVRCTASIDEFRQMASVAAAQRIPLVNAGYVYDAELLARLSSAVGDVADLDRMLAEAHRLGDGPAKFAALDTVFRHADAAGATEFAYRARMDVIERMHNAGEYARAFMTFSWCLSTFDRHPEVTRPGDE